MAKFKCVKSSEYVPEGTILEGVQRKGRLILTKPSELLGIDGNPRFSEGDDLPMEGVLWTWEEIKEQVKQRTILKRDPATGRILPAYLKVGDLVYTKDYAFDICPNKVYVVLATSLSKPKVLFGALEPIQLTGTQFVIKDDSGLTRIFSLEGGLSKWEKVKK